MGNFSPGPTLLQTKKYLQQPRMKKSRHSQLYLRLLTELKKARLEAGLTQAVVGKKFGSHASFVSKCESGERRIDVVELAKFCKIYKISLTEFLGRFGLA